MPKEKKVIHIKLEELHFRDLVRGKIVTIKSVDGDEFKLSLSDMGWDLMFKAVNDALNEI